MLTKIEYRFNLFNFFKTTKTKLQLKHRYFVVIDIDYAYDLVTYQSRLVETKDSKIKHQLM